MSARPVRHFHTKVVGVSHENDDGSSRQAIIRKCKPLEKLDLDHDEGNPHDPNAVRVCRENGGQLGMPLSQARHARKSFYCNNL